MHVHESARGERDVARSMSGVSGLVSRARRCRRQGVRCRVCAARHYKRPSEAKCTILSCIP
eukprot:4802646-Prymnesium_polylepis.1